MAVVHASNTYTHILSLVHITHSRACATKMNSARKKDPSILIILLRWIIERRARVAVALATAAEPHTITVHKSNKHFYISLLLQLSLLLVNGVNGVNLYAYVTWHGLTSAIDRANLICTWSMHRAGWACGYKSMHIACRWAWARRIRRVKA